MLARCHDLHSVVVVDAAEPAHIPGVSIVGWDEALSGARHAQAHRVIDTDMAAILYTSGSTGKPKGVVLSHRNMVAGAKSVAQYLENTRDDAILVGAAAVVRRRLQPADDRRFIVGARVVLLNYLLPQDVLDAVVAGARHRAHAVPPLWIQLAQLEWPEAIDRAPALHREHRRPHAARDAEGAARARARRPSPILMYGLTEAFRATYLPPDEVDRRPDSIGKAIPNAEILVLREDGTPCAPERARRTGAARRAGRAGLLERPGEDGRALQAAAAARARDS